MKAISSLLLLLTISATSLSAEETADAKIETVPLTHAQVLAYGAIGYGASWVFILENGLIPGNAGLIAANATILLGGIPLYFLDPGEAAILSGVTLACIGAGYGVLAVPDLYGDKNYTLSWETQNVGQKTAFWDYYEAYAKARERSSGAYQESFQRYGFDELFGSPWKGEIIGRLSVWLPVALTCAAFLGQEYLSNAGRNAVWNTGHAYIGGTEVPIAMGLISTMALAWLNQTFTGIGEEALFRGVGYEEMKVTCGIIPAKIIDPVIFAGGHIPQEIKAKDSVFSILAGFVTRAAITMGLDWAYDEGGLPYSTAQHMWVDVAANTLAYLFEAGVAEADVLPSLTINVEVPIR